MAAPSRKKTWNSRDEKVRPPTKFRDFGPNGLQYIYINKVYIYKLNK